MYHAYVISARRSRYPDIKLMSLSGGLEAGADDGSAGYSSFDSPLVGELVKKMFIMYTPKIVKGLL